MNKKMQNKLNKLPSSAGVYFYYDKNGKLIYIGKASVLRHRVRSYFFGPHDIKTTKLISEITDIKWRETKSVIEALILESNLIKKYQPKYNIREKDDKSFVQIGITAEKYPRVISYRPTQKDKVNITIRKIYGPYTNPAAVREILAIFRRIFKFRDCSDYKYRRFVKNNAPCINYNINLCSGPCAKLIDANDYNKSIRQIEMLLQGHTKKAVNAMKKQMQMYAKNEKFEKAKEIRDRIYAFEHLSDIATIKEDRPLEQIKNIPSRIECYDISNLPAGRQALADFAVGSMVVFSNGEIDKAEYRRFRIKDKGLRIKNRCHPEPFEHTQGKLREARLSTRQGSNLDRDSSLASSAGQNDPSSRTSTFTMGRSNNNNLRSTVYDLRPNDPAMMAQVIRRRFNHMEWKKPDLIILDGGKGQLSVVLKTLRTLNIKLPVMAVAKGPSRKGFSLFRNNLARKIVLDRKFIESVRDEAHRFAINYHRKLRNKL